MAQKNCTFSISEDDDPRLKVFWDTQSNRAKIMKYLILNFLDEQGIKDPGDIVDFNVTTKYEVENIKK